MYSINYVPAESPKQKRPDSVTEHDKGNIVGLSLNTGEPIDPAMEGIFDNYSVKRQIINSGYG